MDRDARCWRSVSKVNGVSISGARAAVEAGERREKKTEELRARRKAREGASEWRTPSAALLSPRTATREGKEKEHTAKEVGSHGVCELARTRLQEPEAATATATSAPSSSVVAAPLVSSSSSDPR